MKKVYFLNKKGERILINNNINSYEEGYEIIYSYLKDNNYKSYYQRIIPIENGFSIDFGSYSEFFEIVEEK